MKQWEDWIIFLGFRDEHYGNAVDAFLTTGDFWLSG